MTQLPHRKVIIAVSFSAIFLIIRPTGALAVCAKIKHCKRTLVVIAVTNVFQLIITTVFRFLWSEYPDLTKNTKFSYVLSL